jgi:hypothetical protein
LACNEREQIGVDLICMRGRHAMQLRDRISLAFLSSSEAARISEGTIWSSLHASPVSAHRSGEILGEVGFRKCLDTVVPL